MAKAGNDQFVEVEGREIALSNLDKVFYPEAKFTKGQVIDYYIRISKYLLPHLKNRPVTLKRFPDGVGGTFFYEKRAPSYTPAWVRTFEVPSQGRGGKINYILINDVATLAWITNAANLEVHPFLHRAPKIDRPTSVVFDLDPGEGADILMCARVAFLIRELLAEMKLESYAKVSGSKGLQLYIPLNSNANYTSTKPFAQALAQVMEQRHPDLVVSRMSKQLRSGKVFIDWSQNDEHKTTVSVYSLRAKAGAPFVSTPVSWDELEAAVRKKRAKYLYFTPSEVFTRIDEMADVFEPVLLMKQRLPSSTLELASKRTSSRAAKPDLERYRQKRDFSVTAEPSPGAPSHKAASDQPKFVIQKHAASRVHYDFRLEMENVLKSWAVPKGPPYERGEKRLAMMTEDHPLAYMNFEGIIPKGQYGGGTVMVWDTGTYQPIDGSPSKGTLRFRLDGRKLKGEWVLAHSNQEPGNKWYLIKTGSAMQPMSERQDDQSAISGRTMAQIAQAADATWQSNREPAPRIRVRRS